MKYATFRYDTIEVENWLKGAIVYQQIQEQLPIFVNKETVLQ